MTPYAEVIGDPIAQSKSPAIHGFWLEKLGIAADYRATLVKPDGIGDYLAARRTDPAWRGCNVTMPHKQLVQPSLDAIEEPAAAIGAVNTIRRDGDGVLTGHNTDAAGFLEPLRPLLARQHYFRMARILGTGGAARAIVTQGADWLERALIALGHDDALPLCLIGGLGPRYRDLLARGGRRFIDPLGTALDGALILARRAT